MNITKEVMRRTGLAREELEIEREGYLTWYYHRDTYVLVAQYSGKLMVAGEARIQLRHSTFVACSYSYYYVLHLK